MYKTAARAHLFATDHAEKIALGTFAVSFLGRVAILNPMLAGTTTVMVTALIARAMTKNGSARLSMFLLWSVVLLCLSILLPDYANASIGAIFRSVKNDLGDVYSGIVYGCYGLGMCSTAVGINSGIKKSKGDQQVTNGQVFGYGLGGPALGMVGYIMDSGAETIGGGSGQMNKLPGGL
jgi:hypothetical protein